MFSESDQYMIQRDEPMTLEFDEETRSFPCRKCGHLFIALKHFRIMTSPLTEMKNIFFAEIVTRNFVKIGTNYFMKDTV